MRQNDATCDTAELWHWGESVLRSFALLPPSNPPTPTNLFLSQTHVCWAKPGRAKRETQVAHREGKPGSTEGDGAARCVAASFLNPSTPIHFSHSPPLVPAGGAQEKGAARSVRSWSCFTLTSSLSNQTPVRRAEPGSAQGTGAARCAAAPAAARRGCSKRAHRPCT